MDAERIRRAFWAWGAVWLSTVTVGCQSGASSSGRWESGGVPLARGQSPTAPQAEHRPGVRTASSPARATPAPPHVAPAALATPPADPAAKTVSYTSPTDTQAHLEFVRSNKPQVKIVAVVGKGNIITDEEVWQSVRQRPDHRNILDAPDRDEREVEMYRYELKRIIERELLVDDMFAKLKKNKASMIDEIKEFAEKSADRQLRAARRTLGLASDKEFEEQALIPQGLTLSVVRRQIVRNTIAMEYVRSVVRDKAKGIGLGEIHEYYVRNPEKFQVPERVKWQDIFIALAKFSNLQEAYRHAEGIRQQAAAGADFAALSRQYDHGDAAFRNGDGIGEKRGEIRPPELEAILFQLAPGQVSALIPVEAGYHIVKVVERSQAGTRPFDEKCQEEIRDILFEQMQRAEYKRLTEALWRTGAVQIIDVP